ncbi:short-subunit dehydrogenase [Amycolatopsis bartoniae]|uniref:Putative short-chain dehydrogenase/reductase n=1 Tax=Amycolatopsis bartoniae TaxID=941986 RepID=A0A8H9IVX3_9PSEU|nr:SDR family oxidoreductase [Amycolatopsis bartoniae]MBB2939686.1 short-subunit dehydrogenase [Amycolatopsis bartoniae]TVT06193.1 SDR family oxidoreductase [Amycolatopsis bartoniae]GHF36506.1 putative short-chain dehydrogenase/reductase [Amycolatopsis bartoniae]
MSAKTRVLITGCATGIGRAAAIELTRRGYEVVATARNPAVLADLAVAERHRLDVTSDEQVADLVNRTAPVDVLINNAGVGVHGPLEAIPLTEIERVFATNLFGALRVTKALLPGFRERGGATIVNISSPAGRATRPLTGTYGGSKAALELMSESLSFELEPTGARVILVEPGAVSSAFGASRGRYTLDVEPYRTIVAQWAGVLANSRRNSASTPEEVAAVVADVLETEKRPFSRHPVGAEAAALLRQRAECDDDAYRERVWGKLRGGS